jgi:AcrR family transcriptional regulator
MTRDRILAAALSILEREGLAGLTVRKVAAKAGLSPMAMYRHFADKDTLLDALMDQGLAAWERVARGIRATDPMDWLQKLLEAYLDFALAQPHLFDAAFFLPAPKARRFPDDFVAGRSPVVALAMARIEQARAQGRLVDKPALEMALAISALGQGMVSMYRANRFPSEKQFRSLYRTALRHCLDSFTSGPAGGVR